MSCSAVVRLLVTLAIAVVAGAPWPAGAQQPIRIGASASTSGTYAKIGRYMEEGYRLWEQQVNARGGLLGRPVKL
ncbi:MAG: ABC transporter substrate-binding protein, partial [candidate division NC10 bacterium]